MPFDTETESRLVVPRLVGAGRSGGLAFNGDRVSAGKDERPLKGNSADACTTV